MTQHSPNELKLGRGTKYAIPDRIGDGAGKLAKEWGPRRMPAQGGDGQGGERDGGEDDSLDELIDELVDELTADDLSADGGL